MAARTSADGGAGPVVSILYKSLPLYRIPFFERLKEELGAKGVELRLVYGEPPPKEESRRDTGTLSWGHPVRNRIISVGSRFLCWQPCWHLIRGSDLVIVEQATKMLNNYLLWAAQRLGGPRLAYWGHGRCFMEDAATRLGEAVKRGMSRRAHWWFAYTESTARIVRELGFPESRITVVQNAFDSRALAAAKDAVGAAELDVLRRRLRLRGEEVGIYAGSLYAEKRIHFLLEAAASLRRRVPGFELLILGAGPLEAEVERFARDNPWLHYVGPMFGRAKVPYFMLARTMLIPGAVGLAAIDSFALEVPLVTVDHPAHGPEIDYVRHGENGLILEPGTGPEQYAEAVAPLLVDSCLRDRLRNGCRIAAGTYTLEAMTDNFSQGVLNALAS